MFGKVTNCYKITIKLEKNVGESVPMILVKRHRVRDFKVVFGVLAVEIF